jgi:hypothetical protein
MTMFVIIGKVSRLKMDKRGELMNQIIVQIILIVLIFAVFLMVTADKINGRGVKRQVVEKELALLVDSAIPGMSFSVWKVSIDGIVNNVELKEGKIFVSVDGLVSVKGYPYFSRHDVSVVEEDDKFVVKVG